MAAIPENTSYQKMDAVFPNMVKSAYKVAEAMPKMKSPKAVDVSQYQNVANTMSKYESPTDVSYKYGSQVGPGTVSVPYGDSTRFESFHPGVDIANAIGTPVQSFTGGVVTDVVTGRKQGDKGYGNSIVVTDTAGNKHRYSHLYQTFVKIGQQVPAGYNLATMGNTGSTYSASGKGTGSHLDYRVLDIYGKFINPERFLKQ